jgi:drug/metabolite transporter (DMT)-like permease
VLLFSINYVIFYFATMYLTSGLVAVAFSTIVIMNIVFGALLLGVPIRLRVAVAALFGLGGLALVFWSEIAGFNSAAAASPGFFCRWSQPYRPRSAMSPRHETKEPGFR